MRGVSSRMTPWQRFILTDRPHGVVRGLPDVHYVLFWAHDEIFLEQSIDSLNTATHCSILPTHQRLTFSPIKLLMMAQRTERDKSQPRPHGSCDWKMFGEEIYNSLCFICMNL